MATAGKLSTWTRPDAAPELRPPDGCACDLCRDDDASAPPAVQAVTVRPAAVRPASAQPVRQVELQRDVIAEAEARVFADALECY